MNLVLLNYNVEYQERNRLLEEDEKFSFNEVELEIWQTLKWRWSIGLCPVQGNVVAESWRYHWVQTRGTVLRTVSVLFRVWPHSLDQKDCFSRHQGMNGNSSILCFSFTASFYPSEQSLLIILICFCFNCFSGSLFTPAWGLQTPRCHCPLPSPPKTLLIGQGSPPVGCRWSTMLLYLVFPAAINKQSWHRDEAHLSALSLPKPIL